MRFGGKMERDFDVSSDGQRFVMIRRDRSSRPTQINVVLNWFSELAGGSGWPTLAILR